MLGFVTIVILSGLAMGEKLYPDFTCYKGYNDKTDNKAFGTGRILDAMKDCQSEKECYKSCILETHGIVGTSPEGIELNDLGRMTDFLSVTFFNSEKVSAEKIATKIISSCRKFGEKIRTSTCGERKAFISCVEKAWAC